MEENVQSTDGIVAFPPVPNWYTNYAACTTSEYYVYASKNLIVVLDLYSLDYKATFTGSLDKINAIDTSGYLCFVAGVDPVVRLWHLPTGTLVATYQTQQVEVTTLKCIREGNVFISGDKSGSIHVQSTFNDYSKCERTVPVKSEITAMAHVNYSDVDYIAVGYQNGMIMVFSVGDNLQLHEHNRLLYPNDSINSLAWQHVSGAETPTWPYLASSGKRTKDVVIWRQQHSTDSLTIKLPKPQAHRTAQQKNALWTQLAWSRHCSQQIYVLSYVGQVLCYHITGDSAKGPIKPTFEDGHSRIAFSLCFANDDHLITTSLDKQIIKWDARCGKIVMNIRTQSGFPYSLDIGTLNPVQAAVGYGDSTIKIWQCNKIRKLTKKGSVRIDTIYESTSFWRNLHGQVERVLWHPSNEGQLAYATEYGHVGIYDTYNSKNTTFKGYHTGSQGAPSLTWAGDLSTVLDDASLLNTLVTCGGGKEDKGVFVRNADQPTDAPLLLTDILKRANPDWFTLREASPGAHSFVAVNPTFHFMALGNTDGLLEVYSLRTLKVIYASNFHRNIITALHWKDVGNVSYVACGCQGGIVTVHQIQHDIDIDPTGTLTPKTAPFGLLEGHKKTITDLKWSHHTDILFLASSSLDNLAIVWKVEHDKSTAIACFNKHRGHVLSVCWQHLKLDVLLTGGEDRFVYMWNWKEHRCTKEELLNIKPLLVKERKHLQKKKAVENTKVHHQDKIIAVTDDTVTNSVAKRRKTDTTQHSHQKTRTLFDQTAKAINKLSQMKLQQHCFAAAVAETALTNDTDPHTIVEVIKQRYGKANEDDYIDKYTAFPATSLDDDSTDANQLTLLFGNRNDVRKLIGIEVDHLQDSNIHSEPGNSKNFSSSAVVGSDIKLALDIMRAHYLTVESYLHAGNGMMLTDWIALALSPVAGKEIWLKMMEQQASKLALSGYHHLAATCYIACSKVYEAIKIYRDASMYKEAVALLKARLPEDDSLLSTLLSEWAQQLQTLGKEEMAALCYIKSKLPGSIMNAAHLLSRRGTESSLFWSACLASLIKDDSAPVMINKWLDALQARLRETQQQMGASGQKGQIDEKESNVQPYQ